MSEKSGALLLLIVTFIICGPFYFSFLILGIVRRKKMVIKPLAAWIYVLSFPVALALIGLICFIGTEAINTSSDIGKHLSNAAMTSLAVGLLAAVYIIVQSLRAPSPAKH